MIRGSTVHALPPAPPTRVKASSPKKSIPALALKLILPSSVTRSSVNFPICSARTYHYVAGHPNRCWQGEGPCEAAAPSPTSLLDVGANRAMGQVSSSNPSQSKSLLGLTARLLQLRIFCFGLLEDGAVGVGVGVFPEGEEIVVG